MYSLLFSKLYTCFSLAGRERFLLSQFIWLLFPSISIAVSPPVDLPQSTPADAVFMAEKDIKTVAYKDRRYQRYLWVVYPSTLSRRIWKLHQNLLSRYALMTDIVEVTPWLWRVDIRHPKWDNGTWENIAKNDPWFHTKIKLLENTTFIKYWPGGYDNGKYFSKQIFKQKRRKGSIVTVGGPLLPIKELNSLRKHTYSESPVVMMEWLFVQSARQRNLLNDDNHGIGYFDFLQVKNRDDYFKLIQFNVNSSKLFGREFLAALDESGISPQNRLIFRGAGLGGGVWGTLDTDKQKARGVALRNVFKVRAAKKGRLKKDGVFEHNTEEWYGALPNGLPATLLSDDKGVRQNVAPGDTHGLHDSSPANESNSKTLHNNLSCMNCHKGDVLKSFSDNIRELYEADNLKKPGYLLSGAVDEHDNLEFNKLYLSDIYFWLNRDREDFKRAFTLATSIHHDKGISSDEAAKAYSRMFYKYANDPVTLTSSARDLGVTRELWKSALIRYMKPLDIPTLSDIPLSVFLHKKPKTITRLTWEDSLPLAQSILGAELAARNLTYTHSDMK